MAARQSIRATVLCAYTHAYKRSETVLSGPYRVASIGALQLLTELAVLPSHLQPKLAEVGHDL